MNDSLRRVKDFHQLFEHPIGALKDQEPLKIRQLRINLLFEELKELAEAGDVMGTFRDLCNGVVADEKLLSAQDGDNVDKVEELDAICDIQYVLNGKILTSGLYPVFDEAFIMVHSNNMSKAHGNLESAQQTVAANGGYDEVRVVERMGKILTVRKDGKLIKPHDHKKVNLKPLIYK